MNIFKKRNPVLFGSEQHLIRNKINASGSEINIFALCNCNFLCFSKDKFHSKILMTNELIKQCKSLCKKTICVFAQLLEVKNLMHEMQLL